MKFRSMLRFIVVIGFVAGLNSLALAQVKLPSAEQMLEANGAQGTEFYLTIPPNELPTATKEALEFYIASAFDTEIEVYDVYTGTDTVYQLQSYTVKTLSTKRGEANWTWEIRQFEQVLNKGVRIRSKKPISVYVINSKFESSDGFLAIPVSSWGTDYIVTSYYDYLENYGGIKIPWAGGFSIVAGEDNTSVTINLRGVGELDARTSEGTRIATNTPYTIVMNAGDVYCVLGDATTRGIFDMTGTSVKGSNPIGVIGYHQRSTVPSLLTASRGRNHLIEMTPPVSAWGKKYVTVEYNRISTNGQGKGDLFRVIASQPNTRWSMKYYNKFTKQLLGQDGGSISTAGGFTEISNVGAPTTLPYGYSVWEADKPIFVMQYSCSWRFDGDDRHDPFMINVVPEEQFITTSIFQAPNDAKFIKHNLNLIVKCDTSDPNYLTNLRSLVIDGSPVHLHPNLVGSPVTANHMGKGLHWTTLAFDNATKAHVISGNGKVSFGGYIYGYGRVDAYGWPAASGFKPTGFVDTMKPVLTYDSVCGDFNYEATELRNIPDPPRAIIVDTDQVEQGIMRIDTVPGSNSTNYRLILLTDQTFPKSPPYYIFNFRWEVIDKSKDAYCEFMVMDYFSNTTYDTIRYFADKITLSPNPLSFGKIRLNTSRSLSVTVTNTSTAQVLLTRSSLRIGTYYSITANGLPPIITLQPSQSHSISIRYNGTRETSNVTTDFDLDTLVLNTECGEFKVPISGVAAIPRIVVADFNAGTVGLDVEKCATGVLSIFNPGSDTLVVSGLSGYAGSNFTVSSPTLPAIPFSVLPRETVFLEKICYKRSTVGTDTINVTFHNNGDGPDSVSKWTGQTQAAGPGIDGHNWLKRRVNTRHAALARVYNSGNAVLTLTNVTFLDGSKYFPSGSNDANFIFKIGSILVNGNPVATVDLSNGESVYIDVEFRPAAVQTYSEKIIPVWSTAGVAYREAALEGEGIIPQFDANGATLTCAETPQNTPVARDLVITNSGTMDLTISRLAFAAGSDAGWQFGAPPPPPTFVVPAPPGVNVVRIPVVYTRPVGFNGGSVLTVEIDHDATPGTGSDTASFPPQTATEQFIVGSCAGPDIEVTDIDFGRQRANCDDPQLEFTIKNSGGGAKPLEIRAITPVDPDAPAFTITSITSATGTPLTIPFTISVNETIRVLVRFSPTQPLAAPWSDRAYSARFHIENYEEGGTTEIRPNSYANVQGVGYVIPIDFVLSHNGGNLPVLAGQDYTFNVSGSSNGWANAQLTSFVADVRYETRALQYLTGTVTTTGNTNGWVISDASIVPIDQIFSSMRFTASGTPFIASNGPLFSFQAKLLLGPNFKTNQELTVDLPLACQIPSGSGTITEIVNCALTKRLVTVGSTQFSMSPISPNPSGTGSAGFDFSIGIGSHVTIELIDLQGEVVQTLTDNNLSAGEYSLEFSTSELPSGSFFVVLKSGEFNQTRRLVVTD